MKIVIIGAGFGGIGAAIELRSHGFSDVTILDAAPELGGTWYYNTYPGAACDVPSHFYSFSYEQRRDWPRLCSRQSEILDYLRGVAREHHVDRLVVPNTRVIACRWDDSGRRWSISTEDGRTFDADAVAIATGQLHQPSIPDIPGAATFTGHTFHSARWDHGYDLRGKKVAVIGTGASAVQFIPQIAPETQHLTVFQRTPNWFLPRRNRAHPAPLRSIFRRVPGVQRFRRRFLFEYLEALTATIRNPSTVGWLGYLRAVGFMRWQLRDPEVRRKAWPDYTFGCKRVLFSSDFLPTLQRPDVDVVTEKFVEMTPDAVVTADGTRHDVDCVIWGTGFNTNEFMFPMEVTGTGGRSLAETWADGAHAHLGMTVPGFPSMFILYGPNTNTSGGSIIFYLETQAQYVRQALEYVRDHGAEAIDVRPEVEAESDREVQERFGGTAWLQCDSWYRNSDGRIVANWPGYMREYAARTERLDPEEYTLVH